MYSSIHLWKGCFSREASALIQSTTSLGKILRMGNADFGFSQEEQLEGVDAGCRRAPSPRPSRRCRPRGSSRRPMTG